MRIFLFQLSLLQMRQVSKNSKVRTDNFRCPYWSISDDEERWSACIEERGGGGVEV